MNGETITIGDEVVAVLERASDNETVGVFVHSGSNGLSAEINGGGVKESVFGRPSHGEDEVPLVAGRLLERLCREGGTWGSPVVQGRSARTEAGIDFTSTDMRGLTLKAQVIKALIEQPYWRSLATDGGVVDIRSVVDAAKDLEDAITKKADQTAVAQRGDLTLVLDATRVGAHGMQAVVSEFKAGHGSWASALGFQAVWIVGLSSNLTFRLA